MGLPECGTGRWGSCRLCHRRGGERQDGPGPRVRPACPGGCSGVGRRNRQLQCAHRPGRSLSAFPRDLGLAHWRHRGQVYPGCHHPRKCPPTVGGTARRPSGPGRGRPGSDKQPRPRHYTGDPRWRAGIRMGWLARPPSSPRRAPKDRQRYGHPGPKRPLRTIHPCASVPGQRTPVATGGGRRSVGRRRFD